MFEGAMQTILCFNPGSNSLKFDIIQIDKFSTRASEGIRRLTGTIDDIGKKTRISITLGEIAIPSKEVDAADFQQAATAVLKYLHDSCPGELEAVEQVAVRVVHGGDHFTSAVRYDDEVKRQIQIREELAPLHNQNSLKVIEVIRRYRDSLPIAVAFDTAFHQTLPETAWRYPIDRELADKHGIRKFGFHGLSHRYMMEQYAYLEGKPTSDVTLVTMHLESGSSVAAIAQGRSVETSMGFTPLEGLMMGTRSGSIDPAILPFLMKHEHLSVDAVLDVLEKHSGMLGISGTTMDTRILRKQSDPAAKQAMAMFGYRARQAAGAYLAVLAQPEAVVFGGGIGENTPEIRRMICDGLIGWGVKLDNSLNESTMQGDVRISVAGSSLQLWVIHSDEAMQLAFECARAT
jgi:acetate kinase